MKINIDLEEIKTNLGLISTELKKKYPDIISLKYKDGELEIIGDVSISASEIENCILQIYKQRKLSQLKQELQQFIYSHYDQGTQASLIARYQKATQNNETTVVEQIEKVWNWIQGTVLPYYYSKKDEIKNATTKDEVEAVNWDWQDVEEEELEYVELKELI